MNTQIAQLPEIPMAITETIINPEMIRTWLSVCLWDQDWDIDSWCSFIGYDGL